MLADLVDHALQRRAAGLNKVLIKSAHGLFLWRRRNDDTRVVAIKHIIQPQEVTVPAGNFKLGMPKRFGCCLQCSATKFLVSRSASITLVLT